MSQEDLRANLMALGFPREQVEKALELSEGNADTAFELLSCGGLSEISAEVVPAKDYKLVVLVRMDLGMGTGKIAAQVAHAALGAAASVNRRIREDWNEGGEAIIVLSVRSLGEMTELQTAASAAGINTCMIRDAGRTQVEEGSATVCGIGPDEIPKIDQITRHLRLL